jgi:hypothetical protein
VPQQRTALALEEAEKAVYGDAQLACRFEFPG